MRLNVDFEIIDFRQCEQFHNKFVNKIDPKIFFLHLSRNYLSKEDIFEKIYQFSSQ